MKVEQQYRYNTTYREYIEMSEEIHQANGSEYQVRVDGKPVYFNGYISSHTLDKYRELCRKNPDCFVDIVRVSTDIICNQGTYHDFERHFESSQPLHTESK